MGFELDCEYVCRSDSEVGVLSALLIRTYLAPKTIQTAISDGALLLNKRIIFF